MRCETARELILESLRHRASRTPPSAVPEPRVPHPVAPANPEERRDALWSAAPDLVHVGGGLVVRAACAIVLPWPAHTILAAGTALTAATYALYTVALSWMEQAE